MRECRISVHPRGQGVFRYDAAEPVDSLDSGARVGGKVWDAAQRGALPQGAVRLRVL